MKIKDIRHTETNETRTDGRYPLRIGSTVDLCPWFPPTVGDPMILLYVSDNQGNPKNGTLRTSRVSNIVETDTELMVATKNSIYCFEK